MTVRCPNCGRRYILPEHLMGPGGARVRCPACGRSFDVGPEPGSSGGLGLQATPPPPATGPTRAVVSVESRGVSATSESRIEPRAREAERAFPSEGEIAREVLDARSGAAPAIRDAHSRGRLFSESGPALLAAFDEYRRRAGPRASASAFRAALRDRWGLDLAAADETDPDPPDERTLGLR